jgi:hypothetical protein
MAVKIPNRCPACEGELMIHTLKCNNCGTVVEGAYALSRFLLLEEELLRFCELLIRFRGNLKDVCSELNISYPTARNRMNDLIRALGFSVEEPREKNMAILEKLASGEITHAQALEMLAENK